MTQSRKSRPAKGPKNGDKQTDLDSQLDKALESTFPASDPVSVGRESTEARRPAERKPAPIDMERVKQLARRLEKKQRRDD